MKKMWLIGLLVSFSLSAQKVTPTCEILYKINKLIQRDHYRPKPVDDSLSVFVFDTFIDGLDGGRNIFTKSEYDQLSRNRLLVDNYILKKDCSFFDEILSTYKKALERKKLVIQKLESVDFVYDGRDSIRFSRAFFPFEMTEKTMENVIKKRMRIDILNEVAESGTDFDSIKQHFTEIEKKAKLKILESAVCKINTILENDFYSNLQSSFLNTFCNYFDPHSNYFNVDTKSSFLSQLSTSNLSLGLDMMINEKQEIAVVDIVPGSPAAKSGIFEKDDIVIKVSNKNGMEFSVSCVSLDAVADMIYSDANEELMLTVRKRNGIIKTVNLRKELIKSTSNSVYGFVAEKENTRVGYIRIPNFYSDFDGISVKGCAEDVAKEIAKLKKDNISGLVIDLQDNGGGSMDEAAKLVGMFINSGPVSILSDNNDRQTIMRDYNHETVYDGPMVVLIDGQSASASEFFAGTMQDYKRALIAGTTSLGKTTMQQIIPLEQFKEDNFVKLTLEKFYRVTGDSGQIKGIVPDIELPVLFDSIVPREKSYKNALKYDRISTKVRFTPFSSSNNAEIIFRSNERVKSNSEFISLNKINKKINGIYGNPKNPIPLELEAFFKDSHEYDTFWESVRDIAEKPNDVTVANAVSSDGTIQTIGFSKEINEFHLKDLKSNPYIAESINIIKDQNTLKN